MVVHAGRAVAKGVMSGMEGLSSRRIDFVHAQSFTPCR